MPAKSRAQQRYFGLVHAVQKGEVPDSKVSKAVKDTAKSMDTKDVKDFANTDTKGLPEKVKKECKKIKLKEILDELAYSGNIGFVEMFKFWDIANDNDKKKMLYYLNKNDERSAWDLLKKVTGVNLK